MSHDIEQKLPAIAIGDGLMSGAAGRYDHESVQVKDGFAYASDSRVAIRVPYTEPSAKLPNLPAVFDGLESRRGERLVTVDPERLSRCLHAAMAEMDRIVDSVEGLEAAPLMDIYVADNILFLSVRDIFAKHPPIEIMVMGQKKEENGQ